MYSSDCLQVLITFTNELVLTWGTTHQVSFTESSSILGWILYFKETFTKVLLWVFTVTSCSWAMQSVLCWQDVLCCLSSNDAEQTAREGSAGRLATDKLWNSPPLKKNVQAGTEVLPSMTDWVFFLQTSKAKIPCIPRATDTLNCDWRSLCPKYRNVESPPVLLSPCQSPHL